MTQTIEHELPSGRLIQVSTNPKTWPSEDEFGYVPIWAVAPDPKQCRKEFPNFELDQLEPASVRALSNKERKRLPPEHCRAFYEIMSGERRWRVIMRAGIPVIAIVVKHYEEMGDFRLDGLSINTNRQDLNIIEMADYLKLLKDTTGKSNQAIGDSIGMRAIQVGQLLALSVLCEEIRSHMIGKKITQEVCFALGESADHNEQREALRVVMDHPEWSSKSAAKWVRHTYRTRGVSRVHERHHVRDPQKTRARLRNLFEGTAKGSNEMREFDQEDFLRMFRDMNSADIEDLLMELSEHHIATAELLDSLTLAAKRAKNQTLTSPEQVQKMLGWIIVDYFRGLEYMPPRAVGPHKYRALWNTKSLAFQRRNEARPPNLPTPDEYDEMVEKKSAVPAQQSAHA